MQNTSSISRKSDSLFSNVVVQKWFKVLIIVAVIVLSILFAVIRSNTLSMLGVAAIPAVLIVLLFIRQPAYGFLAIIFGAFLLPSPFGMGPSETLNTPILLVGLLSGLWLLYSVAYQREIKIVKSRVNLPLFVFFIIAAVSFVNGQILYYTLAHLAPLTAQLGGILIIYISGLVFLLVGNRIKDTIWLQRMSWLFLAVSGIYLIVRIFPWSQIHLWPIFQYGSDASIFWIWVVAISASQLIINKNLGRKARIALFFVLFASFYVSYWLSYWWKSGWLPALVCLGVVFLFASPRLRWGAIVAGFIFLLINLAGSGSLVLGGEDYSVLTRGQAWGLVLEIAKVNPILGLGPSNYYWYTPLFPVLGYSVNFSSHNNYIDIFAQSGMVGLLCFFWLAAEIGYLGWRLRSRVPDGFPKAYVIGALAGLVGMLVAGMLGDWILPFVYNVGLHGFRSSVFGWMFLGGLVALEQIYPEKLKPSN